MLFGPIKASSGLIRTVFRAGRSNLDLSTKRQSSLLSTTSSADGSQNPPFHGSESGGNDNRWNVKNTPSDISTDDRAMIFFLDKGKKLEKDLMMVELAECDVVLKEDKLPKKPKKPRAKAAHRYVSNQEVEEKLLDYYRNGKSDLSQSPSVFCVYNAGDSKLPQRLVNAKARGVVILEPSSSGYLKQWQKYANDPARREKTIVKSYDFNRLMAGRVRDFHSNKGADSLCQTFGKLVSAKSDQSKDWWTTEGSSDPPIRIMGVADPYKEHGLFATLLYCQLTRSSIFEFGPVEVLAAITPQQYLDFHPESAEDRKKDTRVPKLVRWRARLYQYLFDFKLVATSPFDSFSPEISSKSKLKYERSSKKDGATQSVYNDLALNDVMYWVSMRPRRCVELEELISRDYCDHMDSETSGQAEVDRRRQFPHVAGFAYMHKLLSKYKGGSTIGEFLKNYFSEPNTRLIDPELQLDATGKKALKFTDLVALYQKLAKEGGTRFYNSPFYNDAQEFVDAIQCPSGLEPRKVNKKKILV